LQSHRRGGNGISEGNTTTQEWQDAQCQAQPFHHFQTMTDFGIATTQPERHQRNETLRRVSGRNSPRSTSAKGKGFDIHPHDFDPFNNGDHIEGDGEDTFLKPSWWERISQR
jgi:hypothetical protein